MEQVPPLIVILSDLNLRNSVDSVSSCSIQNMMPNGDSGNFRYLPGIAARIVEQSIVGLVQELPILRIPPKCSMIPVSQIAKLNQADGPSSFLDVRNWSLAALDAIDPVPVVRPGVGQSHVAFGQRCFSNLYWIAD